MPYHGSHLGYRISESGGLWQGKRTHVSPAITAPSLAALKTKIERAVSDAGKVSAAQTADRKTGTRV